MKLAITKERILELLQEHKMSKKSLRALERENGLSNDTIRKNAIKYGFSGWQTQREAASKNLKELKKSGAITSWSTGRTKETDARLKASSNRMLTNNPQNNPETRRKTLQSFAESQRNRVPITEKLIFEALKAANVEFVHQYVIGGFIGDFFIPSCNLIIECDGAGSHSKTKDMSRDINIAKLGYNILRFDMRRVKVLHPDIINTLNQIIPNCKIPATNPPFIRKKRMIWCSKNSLTCREFYYPDLPFKS
jgi:very-short-patch-repair endonuclease